MKIWERLKIRALSRKFSAEVRGAVKMIKLGPDLAASLKSFLSGLFFVNARVNLVTSASSSSTLESVLLSRVPVLFENGRLAAVCVE